MMPELQAFSFSFRRFVRDIRLQVQQMSLRDIRLQVQKISWLLSYVGTVQPCSVLATIAAPPRQEGKKQGRLGGSG